MAENLQLIVFSFAASFGFGIVFRINKSNLFRAGLGGALTRCVYLVVIAATDKIFLQALIPAIFASLFAEIMAMSRKTPSTVFLYPAVLPLIPGGQLSYIFTNLFTGNTQGAIEYAEECALMLGGICIGFVLVSSFTYYRRIYKFKKRFDCTFRRFIRGMFPRRGVL